MLVNRAPDFQGVAASGVASLSFPLGKVYERITLQLGGGVFTKSMITDIKLKANGKVFFQSTGPRLDSMNQYRGLPTSAGFLDIDFTERDGKSIETQSHGAFAATPEAGIQSFTAEVTIAGATAPTLVGWVQTSEPSANRVITRLVQNQYVIAGASTQEIFVPFAQSGGLLRRLHLFHGGFVTQIELRKNNIPIWDPLPVAVASWISSNYRKVFQANVYTYDAMFDNLASNLLNTRGTDKDPVNSLQLKVTTSAADTINIAVEMLDDSARL